MHSHVRELNGLFQLNWLWCVQAEVHVHVEMKCGYLQHKLHCAMVLHDIMTSCALAACLSEELCMYGEKWFVDFQVKCRIKLLTVECGTVRRGI